VEQFWGKQEVLFELSRSCRSFQMSLSQSLTGDDRAAAGGTSSQHDSRPASVSRTNYLPSYVTFRAIVLGIVSAFINSFINMVFNFRQGGGLSTFWITVVCYALFNFLDKRFPIGHLLHRENFTPQEHGFVVLMASAAAFQQSLGLSSGLAVLELDYGQTFGFGQLLVWTAAAGFFGLFLGMLYARALVVETTLPWPGAQVVSDTINAFHGQIGELEASYSRGRPSNQQDINAVADVPAVNISNTCSTDAIKMIERVADSDTEGAHAAAAEGDDLDGEKLSDLSSEAEASKALRLFAKFAVLAFVSYLLDQVFIPWIYTFPILCWVCRSCGSWSQIFGEFYIGLGFPGLGFDFASSMSFVIIPLYVLFW
jgi:hypothetical protein